MSSSTTTNPSTKSDHKMKKKEEENTKPSLSKSQLKKQKKREKYLKGRVERRKLEKANRKLKRKAQAQERLQGGDNATPAYRRPTLMADSKNKFRIVVDMNFEDYMTDSEISKAVQQVGRIYATNRHSESPCQLFITSLKGKIRDGFEKTNTGYKNWDANCSELDYVSLFTSGQNGNNNSSSSSGAVNNNNNNNNNFVYLSGDAEETLPTNVDEILKDESKIYIIGGLVDHNRHKNLCHKMALERKIPTAKLPIKENIKLSQRHILSTVTVFEIMLQVLGSHKSWPEALGAAIPKRKIASNDANEVNKSSKQTEKHKDNPEL